MKSNALTAGLLLDDEYTLLRPLGSGSTGEVWLAETSDGSAVACKILHPSLRKNERSVRRMMREAEALSHLTHPNISKHIEVRNGEHFTYLVMEYIEGHTLDDVLSSQTQTETHLSGSKVRAIFQQLCDAVEFAHAKFIIHRDIKPQNIMVVDSAGEPKVKILDFGHARLLDGNAFEETTDGRTHGSPLYMSPEQVHGRPATVQSDVFALTTVLFELVTLHRTWIRDQHNRPLLAFVEPVPPGWNNLASILYRIAAAPRPRVRSLREALSVALEALIERALSIDPNDRPASVDELRTAAWPELLKLPDGGEAITQPSPLSADQLFEELGAEPGADHLDYPTIQDEAWLLRGLGLSRLDVPPPARLAADTEVSSFTPPLTDTLSDDSEGDRETECSRSVLVEQTLDNAPPTLSEPRGDERATPKQACKTAEPTKVIRPTPISKVYTVPADNLLPLPRIIQFPERAPSNRPSIALCPRAVSKKHHKPRRSGWSTRRDLAWALTSVALGLLGVLLGMYQTTQTNRELPSASAWNQAGRLAPQLGALLRETENHPLDLKTRARVLVILEQTALQLPAGIERSQIERIVSKDIGDIRPAELRKAADLLRLSSEH